MKYLKSRRGIALENAILFMLVVFLLCTLLTTFVLLGSYRTQTAERDFLARVEIEQIVENFVSDPTAEREEPTYTVTASGSDKATLTVWETQDKTQSPTLCLEAVWKDDKWEFHSRKGVTP